MVVEPNDEERGKIMSEFATGIASTIARLVREDMATHDVQNANVTTFKDMRELSNRGGEPAESHLRYDPSGEAAGMVITLPDGRQLRVVVEEVDSDECPYTHAHTSSWCGRAACRDS